MNINVAECCSKQTGKSKIHKWNCVRYFKNYTWWSGGTVDRDLSQPVKKILGNMGARSVCRKAKAPYILKLSNCNSFFA